MQKIITRFAVHATAKTIALIYLFLGLIVAAVALIASAAQGNLLGGVILMVLFPVLYAALGYVFTAFFCWLYNFLAQKGGVGITFELKDVD